LKIVHLSDIHIWRYTIDPRRLWSKRALGMFELLSGRARKFRLERLEAVVERIQTLSFDHLLITGDLTTTALEGEFRQAKAALEPLLKRPERVTVLPGNHDRYTAGSVRTKAFERAFGAWAPEDGPPWLRRLPEKVTLLGLDATRSHLAATGRLPTRQLRKAEDLVNERVMAGARLIVACHYPIEAPGIYRKELKRKRLVNAREVTAWLRTLGPHVYCCGHVHAAWAFRPERIPNQLCLNAGAPLLRDPTGRRPPGFLEIDLTDGAVAVHHHGWHGDRWEVAELAREPGFFDVDAVKASE